MLKQSTLQELYNSKNLLAFSGGGDSTALLFLLLENKISFDIAIVDYGLRTQSKEEVAFAQELAQKYNFQCFIHEAKNIGSNFEADARKIRYHFFEELIEKYNYTNLLTAHHLGDRFEWMLMQFCKGAGCVELSGMQIFDKRDEYILIRPILHLDKQELLIYLHKNSIKFFEDESNVNENYKRNYFRHNHSNPLLEKHLSGIKKSFEYIDSDTKELTKEVELKKIEKFTYFESSGSKRGDIIAIDRHLKSLGFLISAHEKELLKKEKTVVIARKILVNQDHDFVFIAPYISHVEMKKEFKEKMRKLKVEPKLRGFIYQSKRVEELLISLLS